MCYIYNKVGYVICLIILSVSGQEDWTFPNDFIIGAATASYQIEGAWNVSDKGENLWDRYTHVQPEQIRNRDNGDIACDSYHKYKDDVLLLKKLGVDSYRFSVSWSRILPTGYANIISKDGIKFYHNLLDELDKYNITPILTMYHWDHPQIFQDIGGWTNEVMVDLFGEYAKILFKEFGNRVEMFITINEPSSICESGYYTGEYAPGLKIGKYAEYLCGHNVLKAHARAYHIYDSEFRLQQQGKIGIVLDCYHFYPKNKHDHVSPEVAFQYQCGRYGHPIFSKTGDYPEVIKQRIAENSKFEGLKKSRLPSFSKEWIRYIKGTADFMGLNHYSSKLVSPAPRPNNTIYINDDGIVYSYDPKWPSTPKDTLKIVPTGFRDVLRKIKKEFRNPIIFVTENGLPDMGTLDDTLRIKYLHLYMKAMLVAVKKYKVNVKAYTVWSLLDNFEWEFGYSQKYGLFQVDFNNPNRTRMPKKSASWFSQVLRERKVLPINSDY